MIPYNPVSLKSIYSRTEPEPLVDPSAVTAADTDAEPNFTEIYFGYASNLSPQTIKQRCPYSILVGFARLEGWKWAINSTRYANIVKSPGDVVYGCLAFLSDRDETALDTSEGVPDVYQKVHLTVTRLNPDGSDMLDPNTGKPQTVEIMTYVDTKRTETDGTIEPDYVILINKAIKDGVAGGLPADYFEKYIRPYTPAPSEGDEITLIRTWKRYNLKTPRAPVQAE